MSAAEKLRALVVHEDETLGYDSRSIIHNALPQIVAVVEEAEKYDTAGKRMGGQSALWPLGRALAALDEALP